MRNELNNDELDQVVGGTVCISESRMLIMFTDLGATRYKLKCSFNQANMLALSMYEDYKEAQNYSLFKIDYTKNNIKLVPIK